MDLGQAYLFGQSAETRYLSQLAVQRPELWKGVILLNPGGLPELSAFPAGRPVPNVLINFGETEGQERFKRYQEEAARRGISVQVVMHKNLGHFVIQSGEAMLERTRSIIRFVSDEPIVKRLKAKG
jgi:pimeloyl-ACP methyl ester carboxylesterase